VRTHTHPLQDHLCGGAVLHLEGHHNGEIVATVPPMREAARCGLAKHARRRRLSPAVYRAGQACAAQVAGRIQYACGDAISHYTSSRTVVAGTDAATSPAWASCREERAIQREAGIAAECEHGSAPGAVGMATPRDRVIAPGAVGRESDTGVERPAAGQPFACCCADDSSRPERAHRKPSRRPAADEALSPSVPDLFQGDLENHLGGPGLNEVVRSSVPDLFEGDLEDDLGDTGRACHWWACSGVAGGRGLANGAALSTIDVATAGCSETRQSLADDPAVPEALCGVSEGGSTGGLRTGQLPAEEGSATLAGAGVTRVWEEPAFREDAAPSQARTRGNPPPVLSYSAGSCRGASSAHALAELWFEADSGLATRVQSPPPSISGLSISGLSPEADRVRPRLIAAQPSNVQPSAQPLNPEPLDSPAASMRALFEGAGTPPAEPAGRTPPTTFVRMVRNVEHLLHQLEGPTLTGDRIAPAAAALRPCSLAAMDAPALHADGAIAGAASPPRSAFAPHRARPEIRGGSGSAASILEDYLAACSAGDTPGAAGGTRAEWRRTLAFGGCLHTPSTQPLHYPPTQPPLHPPTQSLLHPPEVPSGQIIYLQHIYRRAAAGGGNGSSCAGDNATAGTSAEEIIKGTDGSHPYPLPVARQACTLAAVETAGADGACARAPEVPVFSNGRASDSNALGGMRGAASAMEHALIMGATAARQPATEEVAASAMDPAAVGTATAATKHGVREDAASSVDPAAVGGATAVEEPAAVGDEAEANGLAVNESERGCLSELRRFQARDLLRRMRSLADAPHRRASRANDEHAAAAAEVERRVAAVKESSIPQQQPRLTAGSLEVRSAARGGGDGRRSSFHAPRAAAAAAFPPERVGEPAVLWSDGRARPPPPPRVSDLPRDFDRVLPPRYAEPVARTSTAAQLPPHTPLFTPPQTPVATPPVRDALAAFLTCSSMAAIASATALPSADFHIWKRRECGGRAGLSHGSGCGSEAPWHGGDGVMGHGVSVSSGAEPSRSQLSWHSESPSLPGSASLGGLGAAVTSRGPTVDGLAVPALPDPLRGDTGSTGDWDAYTEALHDVYAHFFQVENAGSTMPAALSSSAMRSSTVLPVPVGVRGEGMARS
jgi:hypothetical protein